MMVLCENFCFLSCVVNCVCLINVRLVWLLFFCFCVMMSFLFESVCMIVCMLMLRVCVVCSWWCLNVIWKWFGLFGWGCIRIGEFWLCLWMSFWNVVLLVGFVFMWLGMKELLMSDGLRLMMVCFLIRCFLSLLVCLIFLDILLSVCEIVLSVLGCFSGWLSLRRGLILFVFEEVGVFCGMCFLFFGKLKLIFCVIFKFFFRFVWLGFLFCCWLNWGI